MFNSIINATMLNEIEKPAVAPWSLVPLLCLLFGGLSLIGIIFLVRYIDKKENKEKIINIIFLIYGLIFLGLEIYHEINRYLILGHYDFSSFPFQFCSIPIYLCLILPFIKHDKIRNSIFYYFGIYCLISGVFPLLFGQGQLCRWSEVMDTIRSFVWHILILQVAIFSISHVKIGHDLKLTYKYLVGSIILFISFTVIAQIINVILHYSGGINYETIDGSNIKHVGNTYLYDPDIASCFYISPFFESNMPVYSLIWRELGWVMNYILYILSFSLLAVILYFVNFGIRKLFNKKKVANNVAK